MCAITSSSEMWPIGLNRAIETISSAAPKQSWRQSGDLAAVPGERQHAAPVEDGAERDREDLDRREGAGYVRKGDAGHSGSLAPL